MKPVQQWLQTVTPNNTTHEEEVRDLFLQLEDKLIEKGLLRNDYRKYRTLHFSEFCNTLFSLSSKYPYGRPAYQKDSQ